MARFRWILSVLATVLVSSPAISQAPADDLIPRLDNASHIIMPQVRTWSIRHPHDRGVVIAGITANVNILEQTASTTLDIWLKNTSNRRAEAVLLLPVPGKAAVRGFMFEGASSEPTAQLLPRDEARKIYDDIVRQVRDPALLEFAGYNLIRSSVFPVEAKSSQRIRLTYETILESDGNRIDYVLPRSESLLAKVPWDINVQIKAKSPISMVYSPSHDLIENRESSSQMQLRITKASKTNPGSFRLSYLLERNGVTASLFAYPDPKVGGGYFLMLAGLPAKISDAPDRMRREITIVIDRSGSMANGKLHQVRSAALQIIEGLDEGEAFNIIDYSHTVALFSKNPMIKSRETVLEARKYLSTVKPSGGTNIHDALVEALRQKPTQNMLPIVLFLTDGLPTVGNTSEVAIRTLVEKHNEHKRRVFTFGVGEDVNVPLLERLAEVSRGKTTFILPDEDVELKVAQTFKRLYGPVLSDVEMITLDSEGAESTQLIRELIPSTLPDVFEGDQMILLGQYRDDQPITFELAGNYLGRQRTFKFTFDFDSATTQNAFVPRLWAARRIAYLADEIRQAGAVSSNTPGVPNLFLESPEFKELVDEIVRLSTEFGILSEYTAFLALEGTDLGNWNELVVACSDVLQNRAIRVRSGKAALNQGFNSIEGKGQVKLNYGNRYWDEELNSVAINTVQQINDKAFFNRGNQWIDASLVARRAEIKADRIIEFGSKEHFEIVYALAAQNRQGSISMPGEIIIEHNGETILIRNTSEQQDD